MLETVQDQAHGLQAWELHPPTRVLPVVATPGERSLELIWRLRDGLDRLAVPVEVMEGAARWSVGATAPGGLLRMDCWRSIPAGTTVVWHAPLEAIAVLASGTGVRPIVAMTPDRMALVEAYQSVKVLHQVADLNAVVVLMPPLRSQGTTGTGAADTSTSPQRTALALRNTCASVLGTAPTVWTLGYHEDDRARFGSDEAAVLLKILDTAWMMEDCENRDHVEHRQRRPRTVDQNVGVPDVHRQRHA